jgi:biopolymer transport protein ExbD
MSTGEGLGMGWPTPPDSTWVPAVEDVHYRSRKYRPGPPDQVAFPVAPMLDMAFQLLAFFILTFKGPSAETHVDLDLPATPAALPAMIDGRGGPRAVKRADTDLENDLMIRAESNELGDLTALRLGDANMNDLGALGDRLKRYIRLLDGRPLRVRLVADERLRYEPAAQIIATCSAAGVAAIRLTPPTLSTGPAAAVPAPSPTP